MDDPMHRSPSSASITIVRKEWTSSVEAMLSSWADISACYTWLHDHAHRHNTRLHHGLSIPVIILSTLTGTANFGLANMVSPEKIQYAHVAIGMVSIATGLLSALQNFFHLAENSAGHLAAMRGWSKLSRDISNELRLERHYRKDAQDFCRYAKQEYDRLMHFSPLPPAASIRSFRETVREPPENQPQETLEGRINSTQAVQIRKAELHSLVETVVSSEFSSE